MRSNYGPLCVFLFFEKYFEEEVLLAEDVVRKINKRAKGPLGLSLEAMTWKEMFPATLSPPKSESHFRRENSVKRIREVFENGDGA